MLVEKKFMYYALMQAKIGSKKNNLPIGCVIVDKKKIISSKYSSKIKNNIYEHAEIKIINDVKKNIKNLSSFKIYTTLEPCYNCLNIIRHSKLKYLRFIIFNKYLFISKLSNKYRNFLSEKNIQIIKNYFSIHRKCR